MSDTGLVHHHEFDPEAIARLAARPDPTSAQWRCAAAEIVARQPRRRPASVHALIAEAAILAEWLEHGHV